MFFFFFFFVINSIAEWCFGTHAKAHDPFGVGSDQSVSSYPLSRSVDSLYLR